MGKNKKKLQTKRELSAKNVSDDEAEDMTQERIYQKSKVLASKLRDLDRSNMELEDTEFLLDKNRTEKLVFGDERFANKEEEEEDKQEVARLERRERICLVRTRQSMENIQRFGQKEMLKMGPDGVIHAIMHRGPTLPLFNSQDGNTPGPGVGCIPWPNDSKLKPDDEVACFMNDTGKWILCEIIRVATDKKCYEVRDIIYRNIRSTIPRKKMIPLPKYKADPVENDDCIFKLGDIVWGLYPVSTEFRRGTIVLQPEHHEKEYGVQFDNVYIDGTLCPPMLIHQRYVIANCQLHEKIQRAYDAQFKTPDNKK